MLNRLGAAALLSACLLLPIAPALAADIEAPEFADDARNPAPALPLQNFQRFELAPVAMGAAFQEHKGNKVALEHLQANIDERVLPVVNEWNAKGAGDAPRTLKVLPEIRYIRFITGGKRFFGGAFAGDSMVHMQVSLVDAASGEVVATPDFFQRANKFGAAWSMGGTDKHMLIRLSAMLAEYLRSNYATAVGGAVSVAPGHEEK
jgi:hypothetical protein